MAAPPPVPPLPPWADIEAHPVDYLGVTVRRVYAYCLDLVVVALLWLMVFVASLILGALSFGLLWPGLVVLLGLVPIFYHTLMIAGPRAATIGMRIAGLRVISVRPEAGIVDGRPSPIQALVLTIGFYVSLGLTGSLILLVALFNPRRRTLHDMLAGTVVVNDLGSRGGPAT